MRLTVRVLIAAMMICGSLVGCTKNIEGPQTEKETIVDNQGEQPIVESDAGAEEIGTSDSEVKTVVDDQGEQSIVDSNTVIEEIGSNDEEPQTAVCIEWVNVIMFNDIMYRGNRHITSEKTGDIQLGDVYDTVQFKLADVVTEIDYVIKNGDSAILEIGTPVYEVVGYAPEFRLAADTGYGIVIYEASRNPNAVTGGDLLDIENKVSYITLNSEEDGLTPLGKIDDADKVEEIISDILDAPIDMDITRDYDNRYFIEFHLIDGSSVIRNLLTESGLIGDDIHIDDALVETLTACVITDDIGVQDETSEVELPVDLEAGSIHELYQEAVTMFFWFHVSTMMVDTTQSIDVDGRLYYPVTGAWSDYEHLKETLLSIFDETVVDELLDSDLYKNIDGTLYGVPADRGTDIYAGEETYEIIAVSDRKVIYRVTVEELGERHEVVAYNVYDFMLKRYDDGQWRFEDFYLVR